MQSAHALSAPVPVATAMPAQRVERGAMEKAFRGFIESPEFPCVGSKLALASDGLRVAEFAPLGDVANDAPLLAELARFADHVDAGGASDAGVDSMVALVRGPRTMDEAAFERQLWNQLQRLHDLDVAQATPWAQDVERNTDSPRFSMSLAGHPFFVIGLHPGASRLARRFRYPALVFNSHRQFDRLRADGRFEKMQQATRARDRRLQGSINPNLADYGDASEARQYSGRAVGAEWRCPLQVRSDS